MIRISKREQTRAFTPPPSGAFTNQIPLRERAIARCIFLEQSWIKPTEDAVGVGLGALEWKKVALDMKLRYSLCLYFPLFFCKYTSQNVFNFFPLLKIRTVSFVLVIFFSRGLKGHIANFAIFEFWPQKVPVEFPNGHIFSKCFWWNSGSWLDSSGTAGVWHNSQYQKSCAAC